jgi:ATP-binding cassette, subfamily B, bacterial PglK
MFFFIDIFKKILFVVDKKFLSMFPLIMLFLISGMIDIISLGLVAPIIVIITNPESALISDLASFLNPLIGEFSYNKYLYFLTFGLVVMFIIKNIISITTKWLITRFAYKQYAILQTKVTSLYQNMDYLEFIKRQKTVYIRNINELCKACIDALEKSLLTISDLIVLTTILIYLFTVDYQSLSVLFFLIIFIYTISILFLRPLSIKYGQNANLAVKNIYKNISETVNGFKEIKIIKKQEFFLKNLKDSAHDVYKNKTKNTLFSLIPKHLLEIGLIIFIVGYLLINIYTNTETEKYLSTLSVFAVAGLRLMPTANSISANILNLGFFKPSIEVIYSDINSLKQLEKNNLKEQIENNFTSLELKNISFKYPSSDQFILKNLNLLIKSRDCIGIIGPSGSGKTTLIDILLGLIKPTGGIVKINNKESGETNYNLSNFTSYLTQSPAILERSIVENISLENDLKKVDYKKLNESIINADLNQFIQSLNKGDKTQIGENGVRLSGGQEQRLALARSFYHSKDVIIMDEATSSLDEKSENTIVERINKLRGNKTIIVITHRMNTLKYFDKVYKLENQKLIENQ